MLFNDDYSVDGFKPKYSLPRSWSMRLHHFSYARVSRFGAA
jgi:hypothetical protein